MSPNTLRKANFTDIYRLLAAFTIVWFHSNLFQTPENVSKQTFINNTVLFWALPFFYVSMAKFALISNLRQPSFKKAIARAGKIIRLMMLYVIFYEVFRIVRGLFIPGYIPFQFQGDSNLYSLWQHSLLVFSSVNFSDGYFLYHLLVITFFAFLTASFYHLIRTRQVFLFLFSSLLILFLFLPNHPLYLFLNQRFFIGKEILYLATLVAFIYVFFTNSKQNSPKKIMVSPTVTILLAILPIVTLSVVNWFVVAESVGERLITTVFLFALLFAVDRLTPCKTWWVETLSSWGQKYSLGIFLLHPLITSVLDHVIPTMLKVVTGYKGLLVSFILVNLLSFIFALMMTHWLSRRIPAVVTI